MKPIFEFRIPNHFEYDNFEKITKTLQKTLGESYHVITFMHSKQDIETKLHNPNNLVSYFITWLKSKWI